MKAVVVSTSLNRSSRSRTLAVECGKDLSRLGCEVVHIDLRETQLPLCDGETTWDHPEVVRLQNEVRSANALVVAAPIYNWSVAASTKNFVECMGHALDQKVIAILCAAGGPRALLAPTSFAASLLVDFQAILVPKLVVVERDDAGVDGLSDSSRRRVRELAELTVRMARGMKLTLADCSECAI